MLSLICVMQKRLVEYRHKKTPLMSGLLNSRIGDQLIAVGDTWLLLRLHRVAVGGELRHVEFRLVEVFHYISSHGFGVGGSGKTQCCGSSAKRTAP